MPAATHPSLDIFLWEKKTLKDPLILTIQFLRASKDLVSRNTHEQIESRCEMDRQSGDTEFSLASAMKQCWDLRQIPHFSEPQFSLTKKVGHVCLVDQNFSLNTKFLCKSLKVSQRVGGSQTFEVFRVPQASSTVNKCK